MDPKEIMAVVVSLMLVGIGIFAMSTVTTTQNTIVPTTYTGSFVVTNPTVSMTCNTNRNGMTDVLASQFNGVETISISSTYISYTGSTVTIASGGMYK